MIIILQEYDIYLNSASVGKAQIMQEGLYYLITCVCDLISKEIHKVVVLHGGSKINLGVCTPRGDHLYLSKRIPVKTLKDGDLRFIIERNCEKNEGIFFELNPSKPVACISQLENAIFENNDGILGIRVRKL